MLIKTTVNINIYPQKSAKIFYKSGNVQWKEMSYQVTKRHRCDRSQDSHYTLGVRVDSNSNRYDDSFWDNILFFNLCAGYTAVSSNSLCKNLLSSKIWFMHFICMLYNKNVENF